MWGINCVVFLQSDVPGVLAKGKRTQPEENLLIITNRNCIDTIIMTIYNPQIPLPKCTPNKGSERLPVNTNALHWLKGSLRNPTRHDIRHHRYKRTRFMGFV